MKQENKEWIPARVIGGIIIGITLTMMFIIKPSAASNGSTIDTNNLWEAVHPFHPIWDSLALAGLIFFTLYVLGLVGKIVYSFASEVKMNIHIIGWGSALLTLLFFV